MPAAEPEWLTRLREAAKQRPRTQFQKIRWYDLQQLLRQRDYLLDHASDRVKDDIFAFEQEKYGKGPRRSSQRI